MKHLGTIERAGGAIIDKAAWIALIGSHASLATPQARPGINPFTKLPIEIRPPWGAATIVQDTRSIGSIGWSQDDSPVLQVVATDSPEVVLQVAESVAKALGGRFVPSPRDYFE
jgi:hypothetical protein